MCLCMPCQQPPNRGFVAAQPQNPDQRSTYHPFGQEVVHDCAHSNAQQQPWGEQQHQVKVHKRLLVVVVVLLIVQAMLLMLLLVPVMCCGVACAELGSEQVGCQCCC